MNDITEILQHIPYIWLVITVIIFKLAEKLKQLPQFSKVPPIITTVFILFLLITITSVEYKDYNDSTWLLTYLLFPAIIALAYPLIENIEVLKNNKRAVGSGILVATIVSILSVGFMGKLFNSSEMLILSLIPKSITTPIAIEVSKNIGGTPELTVCFVILTGIFGAVVGHRVLRFFKVKNNLSIGMAIGAASHVLGTATCLQNKEEQQAAVGGFTVILVGICTAILAPVFIKWFF